MEENKDDNKDSSKVDQISSAIEKYLYEACLICIAFIKIIVNLFVTWFYYTFRSKKFISFSSPTSATPKKILPPLTYYFGWALFLLLLNVIFINRFDFQAETPPNSFFFFFNIRFNDIFASEFFKRVTEFLRAFEFEKLIIVLVPLIIFIVVNALIVRIFSKSYITFNEGLAPACYFLATWMAMFAGLEFSHFLLKMIFNLNINYKWVMDLPHMQGDFDEFYVVVYENVKDHWINEIVNSLFNIVSIFVFFKAPVLFLSSLYGKIKRNFIITVLAAALAFAVSYYCSKFTFTILNLIFTGNKMA